jgi:peptidoglycan/LPS O-acetylase OafA/YrhL
VTAAVAGGTRSHGYGEGAHKKKYYKALDGLRGVAAMAALLLHVGSTFIRAL